MNKRNRVRRYRMITSFLLIGALLQACDFNINIFPESAPPDTVPEVIPEVQEPPQPDQGAEESDPIQEQVQEPGQAQDTRILIDHGGVELWYDPQVILEIEPNTIPPVAEGGMQEPHPAYVQYALPMDSGAISVVEIDAYKNMSEFAANTLPEVQALLANQDINFLDCIPELPLVAFYHECDRQQLTASREYIDFQNGSGMRFVTVYAVQDTVPVSNEHLVYTFQGVSDDQQCYIRASFQLLHQDIPDYANYDELPDPQYDDAVSTGLRRYFGLYEAQLTGTPDGYSPALSHFDTIISSIEIGNCLGG